MSRALLTVVLLSLSQTSAAAPAKGSPLTVSVAFPGSEAAPIAPDDLIATSAIHNTSAKPVTVQSYVQTHERHYDFFELELAYPSPSREGCNPRYLRRSKRRLQFVDDRHKSYPVAVTIAARGTVQYSIDLQDWARRKVNGARPIGPGFHKARVTYSVYGANVKPLGKIRSKWTRLVVRGTPRGDMCKANPGWRWF